MLTTIADEFRKGIAARRRIAERSFLGALRDLFARTGQRYGGYIVHVGVIVIALAISVSWTWKTEREMTLRPGERLAIEDYEVELIDVWGREEPHRFVIGATFAAYRNGREIGEEQPRINFYTATAQKHRDARREEFAHERPLPHADGGGPGERSARDGAGDREPGHRLALDRGDDHGRGRADRDLALGPEPGAGRGGRTARRSGGRGVRGLWRWALPLAAVPVLALLYWGLGQDQRRLPSALEGREAPAFRLANLYNPSDSVSLRDFEGKVVVLNYWASWCIPCIAEHPVLVRMRETYDPEEVALIGVLFQDTPENGMRFIEELGGEWPLATDPGSRDGDRIRRVRGARGRTSSAPMAWWRCGTISR